MAIIIYATNYTLKPASTVNRPAIAKTAGVVNGASFQAGICAGSWVTIQGTKLANSSRTWRTSEIVNGKLPTQLDGVNVQINGKPAYVEYISPTQINVQSPCAAGRPPARQSRSRSATVRRAPPAIAGRSSGSVAAPCWRI